jgi:hypothetical protein
LNSTSGDYPATEKGTTQMTPLFFAKRKPRQCPACKSKKVASIMYGYPSSKAFEQAEQKMIVFGGCCISDCDPSWQCLDCQVEIYKEFLRELLMEEQKSGGESN